MATPATAAQPQRKVRIAPWRGPLSFLMLGATAAFCLTLQLAYVVFVVGLFGWLCWQCHGMIARIATDGLLHWKYLAEGGKFLALAITWVFMLRPLRPRPKQPRVALQVTAATQPQLFELIQTLCWHLRACPPAQVWLDTSISFRSSMHGGLWGIFTGQSVLHLGLPVISVITARELAGLLGRELSHGAGGLSTVFIHTVREMNAWFFRAAVERDEWELRLVTTHLSRKQTSTQVLWRLVQAWMWAAKLPFVLLALVLRLSSIASLWMIRRLADRCGANLIGTEPHERMLRKLALLDEGWHTAMQEISRGVVQHRLPENLSLLMARHVAKIAKDRASQRAEAHGVPVTDPDHPPASAIGESLVAHLSPAQPAASLMRGFVDLSRQVTYFYYQHELGLNLHEHRMVADEEVIHQNRREEEALLVIRRYFGGLAHPERALCGLGSTPATSTARLDLQREVLRVRDEIILWGPQFKVALQEWNQAWQRRRDLEAAATLSLAGFTVSRMQFGTEDASPGTLRAEAARQRMVMEHMEGPLQERERALERRFAAALGMLWWSAEEELNEWLSHRRRELASWVTVYEAMAGALPSFRELLTTFFAFQTLGAKFANVDDPSAFLTALQSVVPKMLNLVRQIMSTMDGAPYPFADKGRRVTLNEHLLPKGLPEMPGVSLLSVDVSSMKNIGLKMAADASEYIAPYIDAFMALYHGAFAWLSESAERVENHFLGALAFGSSTEILLPEEFTTQRLGMRPKSGDVIAAWKQPA